MSNEADQKPMGSTGVSHLWTRFKNVLKGYVVAEEGKGLSSNDFTDEMKTKLDSITVGEGGTTVVTPEKIDWKNVENAPEFALKSDIASVLTWKGSVETLDDLPTTDLSVGDVYDVVSEAGMNYGWTGEKWDPLGASFKIETMTPDDIDAAIAAAEAAMSGKGDTEEDGTE